MREVSQEELERRDRERHIPRYAIFEITYRCNLSCMHCYLEEDTRNELTTQEVFSIIDQLAQAGCLWITFTGGEVFTRVDFFEIAGYARKKNMALALMTNGTLIDEVVAERLKQLCFQRIAISLYGVTPEIHERVTRVEGSFSKTLRAIGLLREAGLKTRVMTPVMKENINEIGEILYMSL